MTSHVIPNLPPPLSQIFIFMHANNSAYSLAEDKSIYPTHTVKKVEIEWIDRKNGRQVRREKQSFDLEFE